MLIIKLNRKGEVEKPWQTVLVVAKSTWNSWDPKCGNWRIWRKFSGTRLVARHCQRAMRSTEPKAIIIPRNTIVAGHRRKFRCLRTHLEVEILSTQSRPERKSTWFSSVHLLSGVCESVAYDPMTRGRQTSDSNPQGISQNEPDESPNLLEHERSKGLVQLEDWNACDSSRGTGAAGRGCNKLLGKRM